MTERLLQYIWQYQYFNMNMLQSTSGQNLQVISPGNLNTDQGPDFLNARIMVDETTWAGSVELHVHTSEWNDHRHSQDSNYENVILHVVWKNNRDPGLPFPTLELQHRVPKLLLQQYESLMQATRIIPCEGLPVKTDRVTIESWKCRLLTERLIQRALQIKKLLALNNMHWDETCWWLTAYNFGISKNSFSFEKIARSIPLNILYRHREQLMQLEAILFGQAGLLDGRLKGDYPRKLQKEYRFLQKKYQLRKAHAPLYFLRMRPANFPTIRLAQLAAYIQQGKFQFSVIRETESLPEMESNFSLTTSEYWQYHYVFDDAETYKPKNLGKQMSVNILINTVVPLLYAYGNIYNNEACTEKALEWMAALPPEKNNITKAFERISIENFSAYDSQAMIQLKHAYCDEKRCLHCVIGNKILNHEND